jgi:hypothetical protein
MEQVFFLAATVALLTGLKLYEAYAESGETDPETDAGENLLGIFLGSRIEPKEQSEEETSEGNRDKETA